MYVHPMHVWYSQRFEEGIESPETGVTDVFNWEPNPGPLEEQQLLVTAEPALQPLTLIATRISVPMFVSCRVSVL